MPSLRNGPDNVIFLETRMKEDLSESVEKAAQILKTKRVGVTTTIQACAQARRGEQALRKHGIEGLLGPAGGRVRRAGQVLGCSYGTARALDVEEYLFIGTGQFHPLGISSSHGKESGNRRSSNR